MDVPASGSYRPPLFSDDDRLQKVRKAAPAFERLIEEQAADRMIPGIAYGIVVDDSLVVAGAMGVLDLESERPATTRSAFRIASMTKSFTAMAILKLRDEGKLSPQFARLYPEATDFNGETCAAMSGYGYGLGISTDCHGLKRVAHGGALPGYGSNYVFYPEYGVGIMAFGNLTYTGPLPRNQIEALLFDTIGLKARELPVSEILKQRQEQVVRLIQE